MKLLIAFLFLNLALLNAFRQSPDKVLYNESWNIMGVTQTLLIPENGEFVLQRNHLGKLGGASFDTLKYNDGYLTNKDVKVQIEGNKMILYFLGSVENGRILKLKFKEYDKCDPLINYKRNWYYARNLYHPTNVLVRKEFGDDNKKWNNRKQHETEKIEAENAYSVKSIFAKYCHEEFKQLADSVQKVRLDFIANLRTNP